MGTLNEYSCTSCDYEETVAGGFNALMSGRTLTMRCSDCRKLVDVCIARSIEASEACHNQTAFRYAEILKKEREEWKAQGKAPGPQYPPHRIVEYPELRCGHCASNRLSFWEPAHGCPKCGSFLHHNGIDILCD